MRGVHTISTLDPGTKSAKRREVALPNEINGQHLPQRGDSQRDTPRTTDMLTRRMRASMSEREAVKGSPLPNQSLSRNKFKNLAL
jgi:hypothetical protein